MKLQIITNDLTDITLSLSFICVCILYIQGVPKVTIYFDEMRGVQKNSYTH